MHVIKKNAPTEQIFSLFIRSLCCICTGTELCSVLLPQKLQFVLGRNTPKPKTPLVVSVKATSQQLSLGQAEAQARANCTTGNPMSFP